MSEINENNFRKLIDMVIENPDCEVFPMVAQRVCAIEDFYEVDFSVCEFGDPYKMKYCYYSMGESNKISLYTEYDRYEIEEDNKEGFKGEPVWYDGIFVPILPAECEVKVLDEAVRYISEVRADISQMKREGGNIDENISCIMDRVSDYYGDLQQCLENNVNDELESLRETIRNDGDLEKFPEIARKLLSDCYKYECVINEPITLEQWLQDKEESDRADKQIQDYINHYINY